LFTGYDGLTVSDGGGRVLRVSATTEQVVGIRANDIVGQDVNKFVEWKYVDRLVTTEVIEKRIPITLNQRCLQTGRKLVVTGVPVVDEQGRIVLVVTYGQEITMMDNARHKFIDTEAVELYPRRREIHDLQAMAEPEMIGRSPVMRQVLAAAMQVARYDTNVLLAGASGTGKSMLAGIIHNSSPRRGSPFVRVDCGSIQPSLFESEVFGYDKGAFTGARQQGKEGLFEMADQGTLFLDEIARMPIDAQHKLLRFLESGEIIRVGSTKPLAVKARVITATNVDLEAEVKAGRFRLDLYYRLNVIPLFLPPLSERSEDIRPLAAHFLTRFNRRFNARKTFSQEAMKALEAYFWPGNVRELGNLVERMVVMSPEEVIDLVDLPANIVSHSAVMAAIGQDRDLGQAVRDFERTLIDMALRKHGTQEKAAKALGISQATIARKRSKKLRRID
jgi:transcriptional regulator with PAS, ATPase and Fis domain